MLNTAGFAPAFFMAEADEGGGGSGGDSAVTDQGDAGGDEKAVAAQTDDATKTALDDDGEPPKAETADDWRKRVAGEDDKFYKELQKYPSENDLGKKLQEMRKQISRIPPTLPKDATPEDIAAYRKKVGIPETPEGYEKGLLLPEGTVIGEADKPLIGDFLKVAHEKNWDQDKVNAAVNWYYQTQRQQEALLHEQEKAARAETIAELREDWGPDYEANRGMTKAWLGRQPDQVGDMLSNARGPDGRLLLNNSSFAKWLAAHIRETEPSATVIQDSETSGVSIQDEIKQIQDVIRTNPEKYERDKKMQARMAELSTIKRKMKSA